MKGWGVVLSCALIVGCAPKESATSADADATQAPASDATPATAASTTSRAPSRPARAQARDALALPAVPSRTQQPPAAAATLAPREVVIQDFLRKAASAVDPVSTAASDNHLAYEAEPRDDRWADYVEANLREYFASQGTRVDPLLVSYGCRSTMCEILAVTRSKDATPRDVETWRAVVYGMSRDLWWRQANLTDPDIEFGTLPDGRVAIVTHLVRHTPAP